MLHRQFYSRTFAFVIGVMGAGLLSTNALAAAQAEIGCPEASAATASSDIASPAPIQASVPPTPVYFAPCAFQRGDADCSGGPSNFFDIGPFWMALTNMPLYQATYCSGDICAADTNCDGSVDFFDIDSFLDCLFTIGGCPPCP